MIAYWSPKSRNLSLVKISDGKCLGDILTIEFSTVF